MPEEPNPRAGAHCAGPRESLRPHHGGDHAREEPSVPRVKARVMHFYGRKKYVQEQKS